MGDLILIGGGARSGKSRFALALAEQTGARRTFIATAGAGDDEMGERIRRHRQERGERFDTIEEPLHLAELMSAGIAADVTVIDCLTLWITNMMMADHSDTEIAEALDHLIDAIGAAAHPTIIVSNEVGMSLIPTTPLGRRFRDVVGRAHQRLARRAAKVYLAALGCVLQISPTLCVAQPIPDQETQR